MKIRRIVSCLQNSRAQILMPAVLLAPIFVLVIYLLFETAKVSMTKVRQQFALDNAAYSQVSATSTYLNAMAMVNGPLAYRVMQIYATEEGSIIKPRTSATGDHAQNSTVFELFYRGGGVPSIGPEYEHGINPPPKPESNDWGLKYYSGPDLDEEGGSRADWEKETPKPPADDEEIPVMSKSMVSDYYFSSKDERTLAAIVQYLETYARIGSIYKSQDYVYKEVSKNAYMFREAYYLNVNDCKRSECARESASKLRQFLDVKTKPFELEKIKFYVSESDVDPSGFHSGGTMKLPFVSSQLLNGEKLFQFAYLDPSSRGRIKNLSRGVLLKQPFKLPRNHFNINLEQKYKPYVRNRVVLSCPRSGNNCVWPNPLPKYAITLEP
ncbi:MAG: hypothetical protein MJ053_01440 [Elusimicrobiaceae bacterium]|nr:hypothetical protein [Elusimicrobiaceae bacterium]